MRHFQYFVEGRTFHINADHEPLTFVLHSSSDRRQSRQIAFISEFTTDIRYIEGQANQVADTLSRNVYAIEQSPIDFEALAVAQNSDDELKQLSTSGTSLRQEQLPIPSSNHSLLCDTSQGQPSP